MKRLWLTAAFSGVLLFAQHAQADETPTPKAKTPPAAGSTLDDDVLKLLSDEDPLPAKKPPDSAKPEKPKQPADPQTPAGEPSEPVKRPPSQLDRDLSRALDTEPDTDPSGDPLARAGRNMREAQRRIGQANTAGETQDLQAQVLTDLETLLKALQKQQKQSQPSPGSSKQPQPGERKNPSQPQRQPGDGQQGPRKENDGPSKESTSEAGKHAPVAKAMPVADRLRGSGVWGHLHEHERQILIQLSNLQYLSEYQQMIEDYYTRLAQPADERP